MIGSRSASATRLILDTLVNEPFIVAEMIAKMNPIAWEPAMMHCGDDSSL